MTTRKRVTNREFARALVERDATQHRPVMAVAVDLRLTPDDLSALSPDQVQAVFEGVGRLAAQGLGR